jgi:8-oxo-dGTP pyrophosphatase MutT (NUDIX family)
MPEAFLKSLSDYSPSEDELVYYNRAIELIKESPRAFYRDLFPVHVTGSALLINKKGDKVLLNHHRFLDKWLCFGGHADGCTDILSVARRETEEESGMYDFKLVGSGIADIDIHPIPANKNKDEPAHEHCDITYLFQCTNSEEFVVSDESVSLKWCDYDEAMSLITCSKRMPRLLKKWKSI